MVVNHGGNMYAIRSVKFCQNYEMISFYFEEDLGAIFHTVQSANVYTWLHLVVSKELDRNRIPFEF
jgi:hypothetical protein